MGCCLDLSNSDKLNFGIFFRLILPSSIFYSEKNISGEKQVYKNQIKENSSFFYF